MTTNDSTKDKVIDVLIKASVQTQPGMTQPEKEKLAADLKAIYKEHLK